MLRYSTWWASLLLLAMTAAAQPVRSPLGADGTIPLWLAAGPFEQPTVGFGTPADADAVGEADADPAEGETETSPWAAESAVAWRPLAPDAAGFVDFHAAFADVAPSEGPERIWWAKAGYAFTTLVSETEEDVRLLMGSNSRLSVFLNGDRIHHVEGSRNAVADEDTLRLRLRPGDNRLLVKVGQSHRNEAVQFFVPLEWQWGFYARLLGSDGALPDVYAQVGLVGAAPGAELVSSFFFRETPEGLHQRYNLMLTRRAVGEGRGAARLTVGNETLSLPLQDVPFGVSHHALWGPPVDAATPATLHVHFDGQEPVTEAVLLEPQPRYELHLMLNAHTDVGYTHPQPTVAEKHALLLDEIVARAEAEPDFRWTIETVWQLEQFVETRSAEQIERLMALVREGRVAFSPLYANPFTGWVSGEEMLRSFTLGHTYAEQYSLARPSAALYNDVPGFSWMLPGVLREAGVAFLVAGINEVYSDYAFQRSLPKVFRWEGADGQSVVTYRTEAYNEGQTYGLVKGVAATEDRMRERLRRLQAQGHTHDLVLLNTTFGDNGGIPNAELEGARAWNAHYAYPRIIASTLDDFAEAFLARYPPEILPLVRGDWTSDWDILSQGELARSIRQRWAQHHLPLAEALSTTAWLADGRAPLQPLVDEAYGRLLRYSAHGSGLEYGYGSPAENAITMAYREQYVQDAVLATEAVLQRATQRLVRPLEAFETEGLFIFNALGVARDVPLEVEFPHESAQRYRVMDAALGRELPSYQDEHVLRFVVRELPALGYRKLRLEPRTEIVPQNDLGAESAMIENAFYRLALDSETGYIVTLLDKRSGTEVVRNDAMLPFGAPVRSVFGDPALRPLPTSGAVVRVEDERPARVRLVVDYTDAVVQRVVYTLWEDLDRVEVEAEVNLEALTAVDLAEEYGLAFSFALDAPEAHLGVLGGFAEPEDRFDAVTRDAYALRHSLALSDDARTVSWAATDSRIVRLRAIEGEAGPTVVAILANHFPEAWNRHEENEGVWTLRFAFTVQSGPFDAAFTDAFGRSVAQPPHTYHTWLTAAEPVREVLTLDGDPVHLMAFQPDGEDAVRLRLRNPRPDSSADVQIRLPDRPITGAEHLTFLGDRLRSLPLQGEGLALRLAPLEHQTVRLRFSPPSP